MKSSTATNNAQVLVSLRKKVYKVTGLSLPAAKKITKYSYGLLSDMNDNTFFQYAKELNHKSRATQFLIEEA